MKFLPRHILFITCLVLAWVAVFHVSVRAGEGEEAAPGTGIEADVEALLLVELINGARKDPLGTAATLGMDTAKILADFPELTDILTQGLPELAVDERLYRSAQKHAMDMLANSYYAYESSDGRTLWHRMNDEGYVAIFSGESLGLLFFNNFISPETAVGRIFANMFRDELDPAGSGNRNILNPEAKHIGAGIGGGIYNFNGYTGNVYLATCDFGAEVDLRDMELFVTINQLRANPRMVLRSLGYRFNQILEKFPQLKDGCFENGCQPLIFNPLIYMAAKGHVRDMIENDYFSSVSLDGRTLETRISDTGYEAEWMAESRVRISGTSVKLENEQAVNAVFRKILSKAISAEQTDQLLFSERARECGVAIGFGEYDFPDDMFGKFVNLAVIDWAAPFTSKEPVFSGAVFMDHNNNGIYDAGEGMPNIPIEVWNTEDKRSWDLRTNSAGGFSLPISSGRYRITFDLGNDRQEKKWITITDRNVWYQMGVGMEE